MSIETYANRISYAGNGVTLAFAFPYAFLLGSDLKVIEKDNTTGVETLKTLTTDYSVTGGSGGTGPAATGTVTFLAAPASGKTITIYDDPPCTQTADFVENDAAPADVIEGAYDKLTIISQRLKDRVDRAMRLTDGYTATFDTRLPATLPAGQVIGVNATGDGLETYDPADAGSVALPASAGLAVYTGSSTFIRREIAVGQGLAVTNGDGVAGNPTVQVPDGGIDDGMLNYSAVHGQTEKTTPTLADEVLIGDTATSLLKRLTLANLLAIFGGSTNHIINGNFDFWQREISFATIANGTYTADRFQYRKNTTVAVHTVKQTADAPTFAQSGFTSSFCLEALVTTIDATIGASDRSRLETRLEGYTYQKLKGNAVTLSFWVKATKTGIYCVSFTNAGADRSYVAEYTINTTNTWEKKTVTLTLNPTGGTEDFTTGIGLAIRWALSSGSDAQTTAGSWQTGDFIATANQVNSTDTLSNTFRLSQVSLVIGDQAPTVFSRCGKNIIEEQTMCERYYEKSYPIETFAGSTATARGSQMVNSSGTNGVLSIRWRVRKRGTPTTMQIYATNTGTAGKPYDTVGGGDLAGSATIGNEGATGANWTFTSVDQRNYQAHYICDAEL